MAKKDKKVWIIIAIIAMLLLLGYCTIQYIKGGGDVNTMVDKEDAAIQAFFADEDMKQIDNSDFAQSTVKIGAAQVPNVFFVRFNIRAENTGLDGLKVRPADVISIHGTNNLPIEQSATSLAFSCIIDEPSVEIPSSCNSECTGEGFSCNTQTGNCQYTWDSHPETGNTGCSTRVWLPIRNFEIEGADGDIITTEDNIDQPIRFVFTLTGEYNDPLTTLTNYITKKPEIAMSISYAPLEWADFSAEVVYNTEKFMTECEVGDTDDCPGSDIQGSSCWGAYQTCYADTGLWPGCNINVYRSADIRFQPGYEFTGGPTACTDGIDNDCDGYADKDGARSTFSCSSDSDCYEMAGQKCISSKCELLPDDDCPSCLVTFRTNADIRCTQTGTGAWTCQNDHAAAYEDKFLILDLDGNRYFSTNENFGVVSVNTYGNQPGHCSGTYCTLPIVGTTPTGMKIRKYSDSRLYICEYVGDNTCKVVSLRSTDVHRCKPGDTDALGHQIYPDCLSNLAKGQWIENEKCEDY